MINKDKMLNIRIETSLLIDYKKLCDENGYSISKRIRMHILNDININKK